MKLLFIGLGVMGFPMAGHLSKHYTTCVYNRTSPKAKAWRQTYQGDVLETLDDLSEFDVILTCIGNDEDLRSIYLGDCGLISRAKPHTIFVDHTTASSTVAQELEKAAAKRSLGFIDAPVSGGEQGAINGALTIMCGGEQDAFDRALPVMKVYAKSVQRMGASGCGQLTKMCNQIAVAGVIQGLAEAMHFGEQADLDVSQVIDVISKGAAQSWQMENRFETMLAGHYEHGFAVDWMRKDLGICLSQARALNATLPSTALIDQFYADVQEMGGGRWDTSALFARLKR